MPIAISMAQHGESDSPTSPLSPRMTKAAFFRARSPPVLDRTSATGTARAHSPNELAARLQRVDMHSPTYQQQHSNQPYRQERQGQDQYAQQQSTHRPPSSTGHSGPSTARTAELLGAGGSATFIQSPGHSHAMQNANGYARGYAASVGTAGHTPPIQHSAHLPNSAPARSGDYERGGGPAAGPSMAQGSDEMLMTLLAGQAAVDCEAFGVASWEDAEGWKKVCPSSEPGCWSHAD